MTQDRNQEGSRLERARGRGLREPSMLSMCRIVTRAAHALICRKRERLLHFRLEHMSHCCVLIHTHTHTQNVEVQHFGGQLNESVWFRLIASAWDHQSPVGLTAARSGCFGKGGPWNGKMTIWNQDSPYCTNERLQARLVRSVWRIETQTDSSCRLWVWNLLHCVVLLCCCIVEIHSVNVFYSNVSFWCFYFIWIC